VQRLALKTLGDVLAKSLMSLNQHMIRSHTKISTTTTAMVESGGGGEDALDAAPKGEYTSFGYLLCNYYILYISFLVTLLRQSE